MRIIDEITKQEITSPDLNAGYLYGGDYVAPESYSQAEAEGLPALPDSAFEQVQYYHAWTTEEIAMREEAEAQAARQAAINAMPETLEAYATETDAALFDLDAAQSTYETETDAALFDLDAAQNDYANETDAALFDLAEYVATLEARIEALEA